MAKKRKIGIFATLLVAFTPFSVIAAEDDLTEVLEQGLDVLSGYSNLLPTVIILLLLTVLPTILLLMTSYTRILVVLSFTRNAMGTQQMPPNQVLIGISLILTIFIMSPTIGQIKDVAYDPYVNEEMTIVQALEAAEMPLKEFMFKEAQTEPESINMFLSLSGVEETPETLEEMPMSVLIPAFITGELTKAFKIGFMIYLPFIMIDMIVSSILMSMGMMMLPPSMISLPFKVLLFVLVDGWELIMKTLIMSFG
ncbi:MAG: flagellar type III secretion system pore protein FliP [Clostridia bacterium]|jgi:flagellar biosynthetic protein FliP|nr:flagellar type III secretion system pore protein FliP [Clostridia bacterium]MDD3092772.1 flagellar type III secretion system pore protein FliP [Clostridia bacterium]MDD3971363.1 flagellar type III secretion system pore protein FliP [Clostridia bacterium]MDD4542808.1 flagellar type III secretion system pore protein FliP [Clostridia bacterium]